VKAHPTSSIQSKECSDINALEIHIFYILIQYDGQQLAFVEYMNGTWISSTEKCLDMAGGEIQHQGSPDWPRLIGGASPRAFARPPPPLQRTSPHWATQMTKGLNFILHPTSVSRITKFLYVRNLGRQFGRFGSRWVGG
jgi:hypothetical protein